MVLEIVTAGSCNGVELVITILGQAADATGGVFGDDHLLDVLHLQGIARLGVGLLVGVANGEDVV